MKIIFIKLWALMYYSLGTNPTEPYTATANAHNVFFEFTSIPTVLQGR